MGDTRDSSRSLTQAADDLRIILRSELRLAASEMKDKAGDAAQAGAMLGGGAILALCGGAFFLFFGYKAVERITRRPMLSALLICAGLEGAALATASIGARKFKAVDLRPRGTVEGAKETVRETVP